MSEGKDRRQFERYNFNYRVTVMNGLKSFKSVCCDISLGGLRLKDPLPPSMLGLKNKIIIEDGSKSGDSIIFECKVVVDSAAPTRISFSETDFEGKARLERWIVARSQFRS